MRLISLTLILSSLALTGCFEAKHTASQISQLSSQSPNLLEGKQLYSARCASCHSSGTAKALDNPSYQDIQNALIHISTMKSIFLTSSQINSLVMALDTKAPVVGFQYPLPGTVIRIPQVTVSGTCENGSSVSIDGPAVLQPTSAPCLNQSFNASVNFNGPNGSTTILIAQMDPSGNKGLASVDIQLALLTGAPVVLIDFPAPNFSTQASSITVSGQCSTGITIDVSGVGLSNSTHTNCLNGKFQTQIEFTPGEGIKNVVLTQSNTLGVSQNSRNFVVDRTAPIISISSPTPGARVTQGVQLVGLCEKGLDLKLSGSGLANMTNIFCDSGAFQINLNLSAGFGLKTFAVTQADPAGNSTTINLTLEAYDPTLNLYRNEAFGDIGLRRLTRYEITNSLTYALNLDPTPYLGSIPTDLATTIYFENEQGPQAISGAVIEAYRDFAKTFSRQVASNSSRVATLAGCVTPINPGDRTCFTKFAQKIGRRLLRRPIDLTEANRYADILLPYAISDGQFSSAIELLLSAWLQHPEFLYRVESGPTIGNLIELNDFQVATRISFFLIGSSPDDLLLASAEKGELKIESNRILHAQRLLSSALAKTHFARFHSEWFGSHRLSLDPILGADMRQETSKLVERIVFDLNRDWMSLFNSTETYVTPKLAAHYGFNPISAAGWVSYSGSRGGGVLSHATVTALGAKFGDTSPTLRGYELFKRLTCGKFTAAIPAGVDTDLAPGSPSNCKPQNYSMRTMSSCVACHSVTDNIGFGLENLSALGQWRSVEPGLPQCEITGDGSYKGQSFSGPKALGDLLAQDQDVANCANRQLFRFMLGRSENLGDEATIQALQSQYQQSRTLNSLILSLIRTPAIMFKGVPK